MQDPIDPTISLTDDGNLHQDLVEGVHYRREGRAVHIIDLPILRAMRWTIA